MTCHLSLIQVLVRCTLYKCRSRHGKVSVLYVQKETLSELELHCTYLSECMCARYFRNGVDMVNR